MSDEQSPRRVYEAYLRGNASFEDVEDAAQRIMDHYAALLKARASRTTQGRQQ